MVISGEGVQGPLGGNLKRRYVGDIKKKLWEAYYKVILVDNYKYKKTINIIILYIVLEFPERTTPVIMHKPHLVKNFYYNFYLWNLYFS